MPYEYDVFLSYRRYGEWPEWVRNVFRPLFAHWLGEEHPGVRIFIDYDIETGDSWPQRLGKALSESRVLVPLFSRQYFSSPWCQLELSQMCAREERCNLRTGENPSGLVVPAHIHDGDGFPQRAREIQAAKLQAYTNVRLARGSVTEELLSAEIRNWVPSIANAIGSAPAHDVEWNRLTTEVFVEQFRLGDSRQTALPSLG
jgi:TIR domain-containing protein